MATNAFTDIAICRSVIALETTIHHRMAFSAKGETWYCLLWAGGRVSIAADYGREAAAEAGIGVSEAAHGTGKTEEEARGRGGASE